MKFKIFLSIIMFFTIVVNSFSQNNLIPTKEELIQILQRSSNKAIHLSKLHQDYQSKSLKFYLDSIYLKDSVPSTGELENNVKKIFQYSQDYKNHVNSDYGWSNNSWNLSYEMYLKKYFQINENDFSYLIYYDSIEHIKLDYLHDSSGRLTRLKMYEYYVDLDLNVPTSYIDFNYNTNNQLESKISFSYDLDVDSTTVSQGSKVEYFYTNNLLTRSTAYSYNEGASSFEIEIEHILTYNSDNLIDTLKTYAWSPDAISVFELDYKYYFNYDDQNRIVEKHLARDEINFTNHTFYSYDLNGNVVKIDYYRSDLATLDQTINFYYDYSTSFDDVLLPPTPYFISEWIASQKTYLYDGEFEYALDYLDLFKVYEFNKLDSITDYYLPSLLSLDGFKSKYYFYYSQHDLTVNSILDNPLKIYPNPTTNFINIEESSKFDSFEINDIKGEVVLKDKINSPKINVSSLQKGIYFLNLLSENNLILRTKIIKE